MSDTTVTPGSTDASTSTTTDGSTTGGATSTATETFKPITSQDDFNKAIADRITRERTKFADYDDVKAKAARLDEIEEQNKSELQKANDRAAAAEKKAAKTEAAALKLRIAAKHGVSDEDADLFLTGTDEATLTKQAERLTARTKDSQRNGNRVPGEGTNTNHSTDPDGRRGFLQQLTKPGT